MFTNERVEKNKYFWWYTTKNIFFHKMADAETLVAKVAKVANNPHHLPRPVQAAKKVSR